MTGRDAQRIRDPVHGLVVFGGSRDAYQNQTDQIAWRLLNTREFQRLRRIRQLGFSDLVFPGATHSRFSHAVGVYHTARQLVAVIRRRLDRKHDRARSRVILLAALLHDIGHGPFSHVFEHVAREAGLNKRHEDWGAEIVQGDTEINCILRDIDERLPEHIGAILKEEEPKDIYSTVVSSQFDADRIDYLQRDRLMTGVQFAHLDRDWLFDCLEVGEITLGGDEPIAAQCLYLNPKGIQVAEEYLQARFHLYTMVYMHKTTRSAEHMLDTLLKTAVRDRSNNELVRNDPVLRYFTSTNPTLHSYLEIDDATVSTTLASLSSSSCPRVSALATRLRHRRLYKCLDIGIQDQTDGNLFHRFRRRLIEDHTELNKHLLFDDATVALYKWYDFEDTSALNKVLVKRHSGQTEPADIVSESSVIRALRDKERIQRVYAPNSNQVDELKDIIREINQ